MSGNDPNPHFYLDGVLLAIGLAIGFELVVHFVRWLFS